MTTLYLVPYSRRINWLCSTKVPIIVCEGDTWTHTNPCSRGQCRLEGLHLLPYEAARLFCDNDAASRLSEDHVWHSHTKHIRVKYHHTCELVNAGDLTISRMDSKENTADILTKLLSRSDFQRLRHYLGLRSPPSASM